MVGRPLFGNSWLFQKQAGQRAVLPNWQWQMHHKKMVTSHVQEVKVTTSPELLPVIKCGGGGLV